MPLGWQYPVLRPMLCTWKRLLWPYLKLHARHPEPRLPGFKDVLHFYILTVFLFAKLVYDCN